MEVDEREIVVHVVEAAMDIEWLATSFFVASVHEGKSHHLIFQLTVYCRHQSCPTCSPWAICGLGSDFTWPAQSC